MGEVKEVMQISKTRYLRLLEDSAILRQIEALIAQGITGDEFCVSVKDIIGEMNLSRYGSEKGR